MLGHPLAAFFGIKLSVLMTFSMLMTLDSQSLIARRITQTQIGGRGRRTRYICQTQMKKFEQKKRILIQSQLNLNY